MWTPQNFTTANFRHPVSKSWLRHCSLIHIKFIGVQIPAVPINGDLPQLSFQHGIEDSRINEMKAHGCGGVLMLFKLCFPEN